MPEHVANPHIMIPMSIKQMDPNMELIPKVFPKMGAGPAHQPDMLKDVDKNVVFIGK